MAAHPASTAESQGAERAPFTISADDLDEFGALLNELLSCYHRQDAKSLSTIYQRLRFIQLRIHGE